MAVKEVTKIIPGFGDQSDEEYSWAYDPDLVSIGLTKHAFFESWYNTNHNGMLLILSEAKPRKSKKAKSPLFRSHGLQRYKIPSGMRTLLKQGRARYIDLHAFVNTPVINDDWYWKLRDDKDWTKPKEKQKFPKKYKEVNPFPFESYLQNRIDWNEWVKVRLPPTISPSGSITVVNGFTVVPKYTNWMLDIDYDSACFHHPDKIIANAKRIGAYSVAITSYGCYQIMFKGLYGCALTDCSFQIDLACKVLGLNSLDAGPYGVDANCFVSSRYQITRIIGSWNYKKNCLVVGEYFDDYRLFEAVTPSDASSVAAEPSPASSSVDDHVNQINEQFLIQPKPFDFEPPVSDVGNEKPTDMGLAGSAIKFKVNQLDVIHLNGFLAPVIRSGVNGEKYARYFLENRHFLSKPTPMHGICQTKLAKMFGIHQQTISRNLRALVKKGYLKSNEDWGHPLKKENKGKPKTTKRYCFGDELAYFYVEAPQITNLGKEYARGQSRRGIYSDIEGLYMLGYDRNEMVEWILKKYNKYADEHGLEVGKISFERRTSKDIEKMVDGILENKKLSRR